VVAVERGGLLIMRDALSVFVIAGMALCLGAPEPSRSAEPEFKAETISARSFRAIQAAIPEAERRGLNIDDYTITVTQLGSDLVVLFLNPQHVRESVGCPGPRPCLGVALDPRTFRVIRSSFQK
jgi:hypothetical protein